MREPTCTEPGMRRRRCTAHVPGHYHEEVIPALGHDYVVNITPPTCEEDGLRTYTCSRCQDTHTQPGEPATGHDYQSTITIEPSCIEEGVETITCANNNCEHTYTRPIPATGHDFGEWVVERYAEIDVYGLEVRVCENCEEREQRILPALPMELGESAFSLSIYDVTLFGMQSGLLILFAVLIAANIRLLKHDIKMRKLIKMIKQRRMEGE